MLPQSKASVVLFEPLEPRLLLSITPTPYETYLLELINLGRANPAAEAARYGIDLNEGLAAGTITTDAKQPLAFNDFLISAATGHSQWMLDNDTFSHTGVGGSSPSDRMVDIGYPMKPPYGNGENIAAVFTTGAIDLTADTAKNHVNLFVDENYDGRGHRLNLMNPTFREIGLGVREGEYVKSGTTYNCDMVTEDFAYTGTKYFLCGVAYTDTVKDDNFYTPGEGMKNISVTATRVSDGKVFSTVTWDAGAYRLQLDAGTYNIVGTGAGLGTVRYDNVVISNANVKEDFTPGQVATNQPPTLTAVTPLNGANQNRSFTITHAMLAAAADAADPEKGAISFRIEQVTSGTLTKGGAAVTAGLTILSPGESLVWTPAAGATGLLDAFKVKAWDGALASADPVQVKVQVTAAGIPEIALFQGTTEIADGAVGPVAFGTVGLNVAKPALTFTVKNIGNTALTLGSLTLANNTGFEIGQAPAATVAAGGSTTFVLRMLTNTAGVMSADVTFTNNDGDENPFDFKVAGTVSAVATEIEVRQGVTILVDGAAGAVPFGTVAAKSPALELTFTINNLGDQALTLGRITLDNNVGFLVTVQPAATVAARGSTTFALKMDTATGGAKSANVRFSNNDNDENPFNFNVSGMVNAQEIGLVATDPTAAEEGRSPALFTLTRTGPIDALLVAHYTVSGTAANGTDYRLLDGGVTFAPGASTVTIEIVPVDDLLVEGSETIILSLTESAAYGYTVDAANKTATATIADNEPTISVAAQVANASEDPGHDGTFRITRSNVGSVPLNVSYVMSGTAINGGDYGKRWGTATIAAGDTFVDVLIDVNDDWYVESPETAIMTLAAGTGYAVNANQKAATVTIADNEPTVTLVATDPSATEAGAHPATFAITRSNVGTTDLTVLLKRTGTASYPGDIADWSYPVIKAGDTSTTLTITPLDDIFVEPAETVIMAIDDSSVICGYKADAVLKTATATITDNEPTVSIFVTEADMTEEGQSPGQFLFVLSNTIAQDLVVGYTVGGTALNGGDYFWDGWTWVSGAASTINGALTIKAGDISETIDLAAYDDVFLEGSQTITLGLKPSPTYVVDDANKTATATIADNEPTVSVAARDANGSENGLDKGVFRFTRSNVGSTDLTVNYVVSGTATWSTDYNMVRSQVVIPAGDTFVDVDVTPIDDSVIESNETVIVTLARSLTMESFSELRTSYSGGQIDRYAIDDSNKSATVTIADWEPTVTVTATDATAAEGTPAVNTGTFTFTLDEANTADLVIRYAVTGTAANGTDYSRLAGVLTIPAGDTSGTVMVTPVDDLLNEVPETAILKLTPTTAYHVGTPDVATVTIEDNEPQVSLAVRDATASEEGSATGTFRFTRSNTNGLPLVINFARTGTASKDTLVVGSDGKTYVADPPGSVTIPAGASFVDLVITPYDDPVVEPDETLILTLATGAGYTIDADNKTGTVTIADNEPTVSIVASDATASEAGSATGTFTFSLDHKSIYDVIINYAVTGTAGLGGDYATTTGNITGQTYIPAGQTSTTANVLPYDDLVAEGDETVILTVLSDIFHRVNPAQSSATVTIADNEPVVTIAATTPTGNEQGPVSGCFQVTRSIVSALPMIVKYTVAGTATGNSDYTKLTGTVQINGNATTALILVGVLDDALPENNETVVVTLTADSAYGLNAGQKSATVTILDNEPLLRVVARDATAAEGPGNPGVFRITRTGLVTADLEVGYTISGTAANGTDFTRLTSPATILAGSSFVDVNLLPLDDTRVEPEETVVLTLNASAKYTVDAAQKTATVTIVDNEPDVSVTATDSTAAETGANKGTFQIKRSNVDLVNDLEVSYTMTGAAINGTDYAKLSGTVTIPAGATTVNVDVQPLSDLLIEPAEIATLNLEPSTAYTITTDVGKDSASVTIADGASLTLSVAASDATATETAGNKGVFQMTRSFAGASDLQVAYTISGSATNGTDYLKLTGTATIPLGATTVNVDVWPLADTVVDPNETVILTLSTGSRYLLNAGQKSATVTITDGAALAVSVVATDGTAAEEGSATGTFQISRNIASPAPLTVYYAVSGTATKGTDYAALVSSVTLPAGIASTTIVVTPVDDAVAESSETVILTLSTNAAYTVNAAAKTATVTIADNEPIVSIDAWDSAAAEAGLNEGWFEITRSNTSTKDLTVFFTIGGTATKGVDYNTITTSATIPAGETSAWVVIKPIDDTLAEGDETATLTLTANAAYTLGTKTDTVTIADNEPFVSITALNATASETGPTAGVFRISRSVTTASSLTVYYTISGQAANGTDYVSIGTSATIDANKSYVDVTIRPYDDTVIEVGNETVVLTLTPRTPYAVSAAAKAATMTIIDNEIWPDAFEVDDGYGSAKTILVGETQNRTIHIEDNLDWIKFTVTSDYIRYWFDITLPAGSSVQLSLFSSEDMSQPMFDWAGLVYWPGTSTHYFQPVDNGVYYLKIHDLGKNSTVPWYTFTLRGTN